MDYDYYSGSGGNYLLVPQALFSSLLLLMIVIGGAVRKPAQTVNSNYHTGNVATTNYLVAYFCSGAIGSYYYLLLTF